MTARLGSLFSGSGQLDEGVRTVIDAEVAWHVEFNKDAGLVLEHRYPDVPNYVDVTTVDWEAIEPIDVLTGGFPCQDLSSAGLRAGLKEGTRSGLWTEMARAIAYLRPKLVIIENVRGLLSAAAQAGGVNDDAGQADCALGHGGPDLEDDPGGHLLRAAGCVLGDLADLGYSAAWRTVSASWFGAPHRRDRVFFVAWRDDLGPGDLRGLIRPGALDGVTWIGGPAGAPPLLPTPLAAGQTGSSPNQTMVGDVVAAACGSPPPERQDMRRHLLPTPDAGVFTRGSQHMMLPHIVRVAVGDETVPNPGLTGAPSEGALLPTPKANDDVGTRTQGEGYGPTLTDGVLFAVGDDRSALLPTPTTDVSGPRSPKGQLLPTITAFDTGGTGTARHDDHTKRVPRLPTLIEFDLEYDEPPGAVLPTPTPHMGGDGWRPELAGALDDPLAEVDDDGLAAGLDAAQPPLLPTPSAHDGTGGTANESRTGGDSLAVAIEENLFPDALIPTPTASDAKGGNDATRRGGASLAGTLEDPTLFPTPTASSGQRAGQPPEVRRSYGVGVSIVEMVDVATTFGEPRWHQYDAAIRRWERHFRPAPHPVVPGSPNAKHGPRPQLSADFAEWMMGWPAGWTETPGLRRRARLRICGNGVVPQQAAGAVRWLLTEILAELSA